MQVFLAVVVAQVAVAVAAVVVAAAAAAVAAVTAVTAAVDQKMTFPQLLFSNSFNTVQVF